MIALLLHVRRYVAVAGLSTTVQSTGGSCRHGSGGTSLYALWHGRVRHLLAFVEAPAAAWRRRAATTAAAAVRVALHVLWNGTVAAQHIIIIVGGGGVVVVVGVIASAAAPGRLLLRCERRSTVDGVRRVYTSAHACRQVAVACWSLRKTVLSRNIIAIIIIICNKSIHFL